VGLISLTENGLYCRQGDFYIDPWNPVPRAVITHAHSDHAKAGSESYFSHNDSYYLLKARLGQEINIETSGYGAGFERNGVTVTLHPAGHMIGSAQVAVSYKGETWVVSGDYKTQDDGLNAPFEPVKCNTFITESTFGLPIYQWEEQEKVMDDIHQWVLTNRAAGRNSMLSAYSLGKAQRLIHALSEKGHKFYGHGASYWANETVRKIIPFPEITYLQPETPKDQVKEGIIIMPPSAANSSWMKRWAPYSLGVCSGWMQVRGAQRRRNADAGFALSDHADWQGLIDAVRGTQAECVYVTHGFSATLARYLEETYGLKTGVVKTSFGEDEE
jgi:putative mRNA 3-end processing factor